MTMDDSGLSFSKSLGSYMCSRFPSNSNSQLSRSRSLSVFLSLSLTISFSLCSAEKEDRSRGIIRKEGEEEKKGKREKKEEEEIRKWKMLLEHAKKRGARRSDWRERERENKTIKKILFKENEEWNRDYCLNVFKKIVC
jgi:hypothetical protein